MKNEDYVIVDCKTCRGTGQERKVSGGYPTGAGCTSAPTSYYVDCKACDAVGKMKIRVKDLKEAV